MQYIRNYYGLSKQQAQQFVILLEEFKYKEDTILKTEVGVVRLSFANQNHMIAWDNHVKGRGIF